MSKVLDINEFNQRISYLNSELKIQLPIINVRLAESALSLVKNRIFEEGKDSSGNSFGSYSDNPIPISFLKGNAINKSAETKLDQLKKKKIKSISYKEWRSFNGLQTNHIDLKFSGDMWRDIDIVGTDDSNGKIITTVTAKNSIKRKSGKDILETEDIMGFNALRFGDFLQLSEDEQKELSISFDSELQKLFDKVFES